MVMLCKELVHVTVPTRSLSWSIAFRDIVRSSPPAHTDSHLISHLISAYTPGPYSLFLGEMLVAGTEFIGRGNRTTSLVSQYGHGASCHSAGTPIRRQAVCASATVQGRSLAKAPPSAGRAFGPGVSSSLYCTGSERMAAVFAEDIEVIAAGHGGRMKRSDAADRNPVPPPSTRG